MDKEQSHHHAFSGCRNSTRIECFEVIRAVIDAGNKQIWFFLQERLNTDFHTIHAGVPLTA